MPATVQGLEGAVELMADLSKNRTRRAAQNAVRNASTFGRREISERIRKQIAFPPQALDRGNRLDLRPVSGTRKLEYRISARARPTSLARFVRGVPRRGAPVRVEVKRGQPKTLGRAFVLRGRGGERGNRLLAIRLKPGESIRNKRTGGTPITKGPWKGLVILYGPSVQQAFEAVSGSGVARDVAPLIGQRLEREYLAQLRL